MGEGNKKYITRESAELLIMGTYTQYYDVLDRYDSYAVDKGFIEARMVREIFAGLTETFGIVTKSDRKNLANKVYESMSGDLKEASVEEINEMLKDCNRLAKSFNLNIQHELSDNLEVRDNTRQENPIVPFYILATYSKQAKNLCVQIQKDIIKNNPSNSEHPTINMGRVVVESMNFPVTGYVKDRTESGPVLGTSPRGKDHGTAKQYYIPRSLPNGTYQLCTPIRFTEKQSEYKAFGTVFVPINVTQEVPVYGTAEPTRDPETKKYKSTGTQTDGGYGIHALMEGNNTTWGCIGFNSGNRDYEKRKEDANRFGNLVQSAFDSGGNAILIITD